MRVASATRWKRREFAWLDERVSMTLKRCPRISLLMKFADNHMINGTKLLNVAGMTRGRRDGILKSEKLRHVVKIGPMHLKGVWYAFSSRIDH
jgi:protein SOK2